jgi:hypothetical protein
MIYQKNYENGRVRYTVTDHWGRKIGETDDLIRAEMWERQTQWQFQSLKGVAAARKNPQNPQNHLVRRNCDG